MRSCSGGVWRGMGPFINGLKSLVQGCIWSWQENLSTPISLGKVREDSDGDAIKIYTSLLSKAGKPAGCVIQVCGWSRSYFCFWLIPKSIHGRRSIEGFGLSPFSSSISFSSANPSSLPCPHSCISFNSQFASIYTPLLVFRTVWRNFWFFVLQIRRF